MKTFIVFKLLTILHFIQIELNIYNSFIFNLYNKTKYNIFHPILQIFLFIGEYDVFFSPLY